MAATGPAGPLRIWRGRIRGCPESLSCGALKPSYAWAGRLAPEHGAGAAYGLDTRAKPPRLAAGLSVASVIGEASIAITFPCGPTREEASKLSYPTFAPISAPKYVFPVYSCQKRLINLS